MCARIGCEQRYQPNFGGGRQLSQSNYPNIPAQNPHRAGCEPQPPQHAHLPREQRGAWRGRAAGTQLVRATARRTLRIVCLRRRARDSACLAFASAGLGGQAPC